MLFFPCPWALQHQELVHVLEFQAIFTKKRPKPHKHIFYSVTHAELVAVEKNMTFRQPLKSKQRKLCLSALIESSPVWAKLWHQWDSYLKIMGFFRGKWIGVPDFEVSDIRYAWKGLMASGKCSAFLRRLSKVVIIWLWLCAALPPSIGNYPAKVSLWQIWMYLLFLC